MRRRRVVDASAESRLSSTRVSGDRHTGHRIWRNHKRFDLYNFTNGMESDQRVRVSPLGGVGEVGKNSTLLEFGEDMLIVDAGVKFPEAELHGVDLVVCDYEYVAERLD